MGNTSYKATVDGKTYEGVGLDKLFESVARNNRQKYAGKYMPAFLKVSQQGKYVDRIVNKAKEREATLKNNGVPVSEIHVKLVELMMQELERNVNENSYSNFGRSNGMMLFGNTTSLSQMSGPFGGSRFGSSCDSTAFGRRNRRRKSSSFGRKKKKRTSFGKGKKRKGSKRVRA